MIAVDTKFSKKRAKKVFIFTRIFKNRKPVTNGVYCGGSTHNTIDMFLMCGK